MVERNKAAAILDEFRGEGGSSAAELYLPSPIIPELLTRCQEEGVLVLGLEGFEVRGTTFSPRLDLIADFSSVLTAATTDWVDKVAESCRLAREFLDAVVGRRADIVLTVVLETDPEKQGGNTG